MTVKEAIKYAEKKCPIKGLTVAQVNEYDDVFQIYFGDKNGIIPDDGLICEISKTRRRLKWIDFLKLIEDSWNGKEMIRKYTFEDLKKDPA